MVPQATAVHTHKLDRGTNGHGVRKMYSVTGVSVISALEAVHTKDEEIHPCKCML